MSGKRKMTGKRKMAGGRKNGYVSALLGICLILIFVSACAAAGGESGSASETTGETSTQTVQTGEESLPGSSTEQKTEPVSTGEATQPEQESLPRISKFAAGLSLGNVVEAAFDGKWLYFYRINSTENSEGQIRETEIVRCDPEGTGAETLWSRRTEEKTGERRYEGIREMIGVPGEGLAFFTYSYLYSEEESWEKSQLFFLNEEGQTVWTVPLEEEPANITADGDGIIVRTGPDFVRYSAAGEETGRFTVSDIPWISGIYTAKNGRIYALYGDHPLFVAEIDTETGEVGEPIAYMPQASGYTYSRQGSGTDYDCLAWKADTLAGWNIEDEEVTELFSLGGAGINGENIQDVVSDGQGNLIVIVPEEGEKVIYRLVPGEREESRQTVTLGVFGQMPQAVRKGILTFNRENPDYEIETVDYAARYGREEAVTQLALDLVTGKAPDILVVNNEMPVGEYARQGALEDLYGWIDGDPEMSREDFMTNVFHAYEEEGCLYQLVTEYGVRALAAKTSDVGEQTRWTVEEIERLSREHPETEVMNISRGMLLNLAMGQTWEQFVDIRAGECRFETEEFIRLLEWIGGFPEEVPERDPWDPVVRTGDTLLRYQNIQTMSDFLDIRWRLMGGEPVTWIGFPEEQGNIGLINPSGITTGVSFAMSAEAKCKEGAWQFMRRYLLREYQSTSLERGFPVRADVLEELAETAFAPFRSDDPDAAFIYGENPGSGLSDEEIGRYLELLKTADKHNRMDQDLYAIIEEEAGAFFAGQKSAQEVARVIQGRVKIYVAEKQ